MKNIFQLFILLICLPCILQAQTLTDTVQDSTGIALPYTNLIATPIENPDAQITFSISDEKGRYKLELKKAIPYKIEITHMGFL